MGEKNEFKKSSAESSAQYRARKGKINKRSDIYFVICCGFVELISPRDPSSAKKRKRENEKLEVN